MEEQQEIKEVVNTIENTAQENTSIEETPQQINWKKFREGREQDRKQREAAERMAAEKAREAEALKAAMDALLNKQPRNNNQNDNQNAYHDDEVSEDDRIERKIAEKLELRERQLEEQRRAREQQEYPERLMSTYKDFNQVCSVDNIDYLEFHYPEVAAPIKHMPEGFDRWSAIYKAVKRFVANTNTKKDEKKAENNFSKPQSMSVPGVTQTGDSAPAYLDQKRREDNWARMQRTMKGQR